MMKKPGDSAQRAKEPGTGAPLHTKEPVTVASFRTWRGWRENVARNRCLTLHISKRLPGTGMTSDSSSERRGLPRLGSAQELLNYHQSMADSECAAYQELKDRENRAHAAWTSFLYRNENKPKLSERANRRQQKEKMKAYEQAHKARLAHAKTCPACVSNG